MKYGYAYLSCVVCLTLCRGVLCTENVSTSGPAPSPVELCTPLASSADQSPPEEVVRPNARLPVHLLPIRYNLTLHPLLQPPWTLEGTLQLTFLVNVSSSNITLNMLDIVTKNDTATLHELSADKSTDENIPIVSQQYDQDRQMYTVHLARPMNKGSVCTFTVQYQGLLNDKLVGFYRSSYTSPDGNKRWLATTQFSPTDARRAFPGFDEPGFKSEFDITIIHPSNLTAKSNMPLKSQLNRADGSVASHFELTKVMSTFIVAFHVSDFVSLPPPVKIGDIDFTVWSRPEVIDQAAYAKSVGPAYVEFLQDYFDISYPLPKLEMVAIPDFKFNGMENWGFITYRETAMLLDANDSAPADIFNVAYVIAHEVSHQWFGNLVTPKWWSELWLKEGFASFVGYLAMDHVEPGWGVMAKFVNDYQQSVMTLDSLQSSHPINVPVNHPDQISEIFDKISYEKGASILRMLHNFVGPAAFREGLSNYLRELQYKGASQEDLWRHLQAAGGSSLPAGVTVETVMDSWTYKSGYPVVSVTRNKNSFTLQQEQFLLGNKSKGVGWWIPITYTDEKKMDFTAENLKTSTWMTDDPSQLIVIDMNVTIGQWVTFNLRGSGFFRVSYEPHDWLLLRNQLSRDRSVFPPEHRATLLDDAFNLARDGVLEYTELLDTTTYLTREKHYVPWEVSLRGFTHMYYLLQRDPAFGLLKSYLLSLVTNWYETLGFLEIPRASYPERRAQETAIRWACILGHPHCLSNAKNLFDAWVKDVNSTGPALPALVRRSVLCLGVARGSQEVWDAVWRRTLQTEDPALRINLLQALGCTKHVWLLSRYLERAFTDSAGVRKQDAETVYWAVASNPAGTDLAWRYVRTNWQRLVQYLGSNNRSLGRLVSRLGHSFNSQLHVQELEAFMREQRGKLAAGERSTRQTLETVQLNVRWMDSHYSTVVSWLDQHHKLSEQIKASEIHIVHN